MDVFYERYELQRQPKKKMIDGVEAEAQYGSCAFMPRRQQKEPRLEPSFCQKNKWTQDWNRYWFYLRTSGLTTIAADGKRSTRYPLASVMTEMVPYSQVDARSERSAKCSASNKVFALACWYSSGRDLIEEMVAAKYWPLGREKPKFEIEMMKLPVFGGDKGIPFPWFKIRLAEGETAKEFVVEVEHDTRAIVGEISNRKFLAQRSAAGMLPHLNCVFEEMGLEHRERQVPAKVLRAIRKKEGAVHPQGGAAVAEAKKRKGQGHYEEAESWCWWFCCYLR